MKVSFVIPFHNEEKNASRVIQKVIFFAKKNKIICEIIPVDDRSTDKTALVLKKETNTYPKIVFPLFRKKDSMQKGNTMGLALREGTQRASGQIIIWTMGDLADSVETYLEIIKKIQSGYDMVFGSRYMLGGSRGNLGYLKAFLSSSGTKLASLLFGIKVHDITNAFRGFKSSVFKEVTLESEGFSISPEFAIKAHLAGFKLGEVPTIYSNRVEGVSNFKLFSMILSYLRLYLYFFYKYKLLRYPSR